MRIYIILFIYILSCIGIMVDFHYCGGELVSVTLYHADEENCCGEDEEKPSSCCQDKFLVVETDDSENQKTFTFQTVDLNKSITPVYYTTHSIDYQVLADKNIVPVNHAPPNGNKDPLFIKNRILRI